MSALLTTACGNNSDDGPRSSRVLINEALASNVTMLDQDGETSDWLELYNAGNAPQSLAGWTLTDDEERPDQWSLPDIMLQGGQYLLIWASDKDRVDAELHTNFKISGDGETLYLFDTEGELVGRLEVPAARTGVSIGSNESGAPVFFDSPTPGEANAARSYSGVVNSMATFDQAGGENSAGPVSLSGAGEGETIRYTLDATAPTESSPTYTAPIPVQDSTVIRARVFRENQVPSAVESRTFLRGETHDLPVVALVTEPANFFDQDTGIYVYGDSYEDEIPFYGANFWEDWEKEIHFTFYEPDGTLGVALNAGVKIFGGWTRSQDQRSLSIFARGRYGVDEIEYPLFPDLPYDEFQGLVLRNAGNDWMYTMIRDAVLTSLMEGSGLDYQAYRPTVVYLNGEYWGLYNLREKVNEHFLASKHDLDPDDINILENRSLVVEGSDESYLELTGYVTNNSLADAEHYAWVAERIDLDNFINYQVAQIYFNNDDWPGNNIKYWNSPTTKWRWILFGTEFGFGLYGEDRYSDDSLSFATATDGPDWPNPPWSTLLLRRLLENPDFRNQFINTFMDGMNSRFRPERVIHRIDEYAAPIASEITRHAVRWLQPEEDEVALIPDIWAENMDVMKTFAEQRPVYMKEHLARYFGLREPVPVKVTIDSTAQGQVYVNSVLVNQTNWEGEYFPGIPVTVTAVPAEGFRFSHWSGTSDVTDATIELDPETLPAVQPVFVVVEEVTN